MPQLTEKDLETLRDAKKLLTSRGLAAKLTDQLGAGLERGMKKIPAKYAGLVDQAVKKALGKGLDVAVGSLGKGPRKEGAGKRGLWLHKAAAGVTGGVGGFFGLASVLAELPASTVIMLRAVADVAAENGEDLSDPETRLSCLEVFALGGPDKSDDGVETGYFAVRGALAAYLRTASGALGAASADAGGTAVAKFINQIAMRFAPAVTDKLAASLVPVAGAVSGAAVNVIFTSHFQTIARGHFAIRRLERLYGREAVRAAYENA